LITWWDGAGVVYKCLAAICRAETSAVWCIGQLVVCVEHVITDDLTLLFFIFMFL